MADLVIAIGALADVQLSSFQVNVFPSQPAQFAGAQARKGCYQQKSTPLAVRSVDHALNLVRGRNIAAYLKRALIARIPLDRHIARDVQVLRSLQQRFEAGENLPRQRAGEVL